MRRGFWKELRTRALTGVLAGTLLVGSIAGPVQMVRAADTDTDAVEEVMGDTSDEESPEITDENFLVIMDDYKEQAQTTLEDQDQSPFGLDDLALKVLKHVVKKSGEKLEDKAFDTVFSVVFGDDNSGREILEKLDVLEGKIDKITEMLNQIGIFLKKQVLKDSLTLKQTDMRAIKAAVDQATLDYKEAKTQGGTEKQVKDRRWKVLQSYYSKFSLQGTGDAMTSMRYFCYRLINDGNLNGDLGNYVAQYEKYGKYSFDWDVDRVAFTQAQKDRDVYYLAQMASLNLLYLQYAQEYEPHMQGDGASKEQIADLLNKVVKCYEETPVVKLDTEKIHFEKVTEVDMNGDNDKTVAISINRRISSLSGNNISSAFKYEAKEDREIKVVQNYIAGEIERGGAREKGYHLMTNAERDILVSAAKQKNITLMDYMMAGGVHTLGQYSREEELNITTSLYNGFSSPLSYGDSHMRRKAAYFEKYNINAIDGYKGTQLCKVFVNWRDLDKFSFSATHGSYTACVCQEEDYFKEFVNKNYVTLFVKDDSTRLEDKGYSENGNPSAEGTIVDITRLSWKKYQVTLKADDDQIEIICDNNIVEDQNLEEGQKVTIDYCDEGEELHALSITILEKGDNDSQSVDENKQDTEQQPTEDSQQN